MAHGRVCVGGDPVDGYAAEVVVDSIGETPELAVRRGPEGYIWTVSLRRSLAAGCSPHSRAYFSLGTPVRAGHRSKELLRAVAFSVKLRRHPLFRSQA
jgi:hypothetical protein